MTVRAEIEVDIAEIGARGDGVARLPDGSRLYVPATAPGDRVRVRVTGGRDSPPTARVVALLAPGPDRAEPPCRHFGACGGCAFQHISTAAALAWKTARIRSELSRRDLPADRLLPAVAVPPGRRRRADLKAVRRQGDLVLGFNARASHRVIDLAECPMLRPEIVRVLPALRETLLSLFAPGESARVAVALVEGGVDLLLETAASLGAAGRERLAAFAEAADLARLSIRHPRASGAEPLAERRPARVLCGGVAVAIPPGAFQQAAAEGEAALVDFVREGVGGARRVADLFAGCGAFALPLAGAGAAVHAVEGDGAAARALDAAARGAGLRVAVERRDLFRRPLAPAELAAFEAVVFDPPRAGARAQAAAIAEARVATVVAVSCNPATFARDAAILTAAGYRLDRVLPVDQFPWSTHVEIAAVLRRDAGRRRAGRGKRDGTRGGRRR